MDKFEELLLSSQEIFKGRLLSLKVDTVRMPNGLETTREIVQHPGAVAMIALTDKKELILVRQFRRPTDEVLLEIPAGVPRLGESGEAAARRELGEETGYQAKKVKKLWAGYTSPGYSNELIHYYLAEELTLTNQQTDEDEFVEPELVGIKLCFDYFKSGQIKDNKTLIGIVLADRWLKGEL